MSSTYKTPGSIEANTTDTVCPETPCAKPCETPAPCPTPKVVITQRGGGADCCNQDPCCNRDPCCNEVPVTHFRQRASICAEDCREVVYVNTISQVFKTKYAFSMPSCGASIRVVFAGVSDVAIGAYLWAMGIGSLRIKGFNANTSEIELENTCTSGCDQAPPGTPIAACTPFVLSPPDCGSQSSNLGATSLYPFLDAGFTAPSEGACIDITVTNVTGLSIGKNISINNGIYRINAVLSATRINICNDCCGLVAGTVVEYLDGAGNHIVPIILIDANPCSSVSVHTGKPLVCSGTTTVPIEGTENGQVLVWDSVTGNSNFRTLGIPLLDCTELTVCLTLDPALPEGTPYLVQVLSTADFVDGEIVTIGGTEFTIDSITDATHLYLIPTDLPSAIQTYNIGAALCSADCCTILSARIDSIGAEANSGDAAAIADATLTLGQAATGNVATLLITNASLTKTMGVHWSITSHWIFDLNGVVGKYVNANIVQSVIIEPTGVAAYTTVYNDQANFAVVGAGLTINRQSMGRTYHGYTAIPPNSTMIFRGRSDIAYLAGDVTNIIVRQSGTRISYLGVAIL